MTVRLVATLLTYGETSLPDPWGDVVVFAPGALYTDDHQRVGLFVNHDTRREAAGVAERVWTEGDVVRGEFVTLDTPSGRLLELELAAGVRRDVSIGAYLDEFTVAPVDPQDRDPWAPQVYTVTAADLAETSSCLRGRFPSARIDSVSTDDGQPEGTTA